MKKCDSGTDDSVHIGLEFERTTTTMDSGNTLCVCRSSPAPKNKLGAEAQKNIESVGARAGGRQEPLSPKLLCQ